jgi:disulfide bond formation protein DsbB
MTRPLAPAPVGAILAALGIAMLGGALAFQYLGGLAPCPLCIWQRWPWAAAVPLGAGAWAAWRAGRRAPARGLLALGGLAVLAGAGIAAFHVGVEQGWWQGTAACAGQIYEAGLSAEELRRRLLTAEVVRCDEVPWSLFGVSMAGYNMLASLGAAGLALFAALWPYAGPGGGGSKV